MGMAPESKPDWSKGMSQQDTVHSTTIVQQSGEFELRIDVRKTQQDRTRPRRFQFGVSLANHTGGTRQTIVWNSRSPAIPATISMLTVPSRRNCPANSTSSIARAAGRFQIQTALI